MNQEKIYLAIGIGPDQVMVTFWSPIGSNKLELSERNKFLAEGGQESYLSDEELLASVEASYKNAWSLLPEEIRNQADGAGVIFSVPQHWFKGDQINSSKSTLLKEILNRLGSRLLGLVPEGELLLTIFKKKENGFINLVPVSVGEEKISVFPIVRDKILGVQLVERSENIALDLEEGLARFESWQSFPPRILLLGSDDLEQVRTDLLSYPWTKSGKGSYFFHLPKVEIFSYRLILVNLIDQAQEFLPEEKIDLPLSAPPVSAASWDQEESREKEVPNQALGFVKNQDVASFGTAEPESLVQDRKKTQSTPIKTKKSNGKDILVAGWRKLTTAIRKVKIDLQGKSASGGSFKPKKNLSHGVVILFLVIGLVFGVLFAAWWYLPRAEVTLAVAPKYSQGSTSLLMAPGVSEANVEKGLVPAHQAMATESGSDSIDTTGEELVGEKAKGEVLIYNRTKIEKIFEKGTVLIGDGDLEFLLDEEVVVEPASIEVDEDYNQTVTPSKKKASVVAGEIGADYNLSAGQEFLVASFIKDDFVAKNEESFSGGSSHKAKVVTKEDQQNLKKVLLESLTEKGAEEITKQLSAGEKLIRESLVLEVVEEDFSHELGEETEQVSLTLVVNLTGLAYWEKDLDYLMEKLLEKEVPQGFIVGEERQVDFKFVEEQETGFLFDLSFGCSLYPDINEDEVRNKIAGRRASTIEDYLYLLPSVNDFKIEVSPPLPDFLLTLPHQPNNISIKMEVGE